MGFWQNVGDAWQNFRGSVFGIKGPAGATYIGDYAGKDKLLGAGEYREEMRKSAEDAMASFYDRSAGVGPRTGYGIGKALEESGVKWNFDPTNVESIAEALSKQAFHKDMQGQLEGDILESDLFQTTGRGMWGNRRDDYKPYYGEISDEGYLEVGEGARGVGGAYEDWYGEERQREFMDRASLIGISKQDLEQLSPGASKWRKMAAPLTGEAKDVYRQGLGSVMSGLGNLRSGSAMRQRKELLQDYGSRMTDIRGGIRGKRQSLADKLTQKISKAFEQG